MAYDPHMDGHPQPTERLRFAPERIGLLRRAEDRTAALDDLAARGLQVGRGAFGGWDDADARLGQVAWCLARHLRPKRIVETGVARGLTTRVLLEALERNGRGRLWSIDLPPLLERGLAQETGAAVPERLHERWTLLRGSSRKLLPDLVAALIQIDEILRNGHVIAAGIPAQARSSRASRCFPRQPLSLFLKPRTTLSWALLASEANGRAARLSRLARQKRPPCAQWSVSMHGTGG
jgi:Methyltransferase domain